MTPVTPLTTWLAIDLDMPNIVAFLLSIQPPIWHLKVSYSKAFKNFFSLLTKLWVYRIHILWASHQIYHSRSASKIPASCTTLTMKFCMIFINLPSTILPLSLHTHGLSNDPLKMLAKANCTGVYLGETPLNYEGVEPPLKALPSQKNGRSEPPALGPPPQMPIHVYIYICTVLIKKNASSNILFHSMKR